jgi:periplasmic protein TonB
MTAFALHLPERRGLSRWVVAGLTIAAAHGAIISSAVLWYARQPVTPTILPAISVSLAPVDASSPEEQNQDIAVGPTMQQAEEAPKEPPKVEEPKVEQEMQPPPPQQQAEVALPAPAPKPVEEPKPQAPPPAPETRAPPPSEHVGRFSQAASNAYDALVLGHLQRFKRYPSAARGASGRVEVKFELNRDGQLTDVEVTKSSGNNVLDQEMLAIIRHASPFPPFPAAKPGTEASYIWSLNFAR